MSYQTAYLMVASIAPAAAEDAWEGLPWNSHWNWRWNASGTAKDYAGRTNLDDSDCSGHRWPHDANAFEAALTLDACPDNLGIVSVKVCVRRKYFGGTGVPGQEIEDYLDFMGDSWASQDTEAAFTWREKTYTVHPVRGDAFVSADFLAPAFNIGGTDPGGIGGGVDYSAIVVEVVYVAVPSGSTVSREIGSRGLRYVARPLELVQTSAPLWAGRYDVMQDASLSHIALGETGSGEELEERAAVTILTRKIPWDPPRVEHTLLQQRRIACCDWDTCYSPEDPASAECTGIARLTRGVRSFARASKAWIHDPVDRRIVEIPIGCEKPSADGLLIERASDQLLLRSAFVSGVVGLTLNGTGSNGSAITADTANLLFRSIVSGNSLKILSGTPIHAADLEAVWPATAAVAGSAALTLSCAHKDVGGQLFWWLQRTSDDAFYYDASDSTWKVAKTWNAMPVETDWLGNPYQCQLALGANPSTLTLGVGVPTTGTAGSLHYVGRVQLELGYCATSPIVTDDAVYSRSADDLAILSSHGRRAYPTEQGSCRIIIAPLWNGADLPANSYRTLSEVIHDATNWERVYWEKNTGLLKFMRSRLGVQKTASIAWTPTRYQIARIGWRFTGEYGDLGLTPYTLDVFLDGQKGTSATAAGSLIPASSGQHTIGNGLLADDYCDCRWYSRELTEFVLTDNEMGDL